jgi:hypothetical protein
MNNNMLEIKDLAGLSEPLCRVIDCLYKGISSLASPIVYRRMERAKMQIESNRADQNAMIFLKEAMAQDFITVARTTRDKQEIANITAIYGMALQELQMVDTLKLPEKQVSSEWAACFYDNAKYCGDEEVQILWAGILAGEIQAPGSFFKRTLSNLRLVEKHEAEWFCDLCRYVIEGSYFPLLLLENETISFNRFQSLVDAGFVNAEQGRLIIDKDEIIPLKSQKIDVHCIEKGFNLPVYTLTDMGAQLYSLVPVETDGKFLNELVRIMNESTKIVVKVI